MFNSCEFFGNAKCIRLVLSLQHFCACKSKRKALFSQLIGSVSDYTLFVRQVIWTCGTLNLGATRTLDEEICPIGINMLLYLFYISELQS